VYPGGLLHRGLTVTDTFERVGTDVPTAQKGGSMGNRLRYADDHWTNDPSPDSALRKANVLGGLIVNQVEEEMFSSLLPDRMEGLSILDFGCGCGGFAVACAKKGATVVGIDASECAIAAATRLASQEGVGERCHFIVGLEVQGNGFDLVLAKDVLEHIDDDVGWIAGVAKALKRDGRLIFATQNKSSLNYLIEGAYHRLWRGDKKWMGWDPTHVRFYTPWRLKRMLKANGLRIDQWASMWIIPYNILMWLSLLRLDVTIPALRHIDYAVGKLFPFNQTGWVLMASCRRV